MFVEIIKVFIL